MFANRYNATGYLARVERGGLVLWQATAQDAAGRTVSALLGNGLTEGHTYDPNTGRLKNGALSTAAGAARLSEGYAYNLLGNMTNRTQYWNGTTGFMEDFAYDDLNRLFTSKVNGVTKTYLYDDAGSILSKPGTGTGNYAYPPQGANAQRPHAVQSIAGIAGAFAYDDNGNQTAAPGRTASWTSFDMPLQLAKGGVTANFVYGPEHQRTRQGRGADGTGYAGGREVETNGGEVKIKTYWPLGIGVEIETVGKGTALYWIHKDRLGSPVAITDQNGVLQDPLAYDAWGKRRSQDGGSTDDAIVGKVDNKGFTGHEMLDTVDLVHMNGRVYDPQLGRFLSADPLVQDPLNGQSYNRYSYVLNNPTNLTDPTGFESEEKIAINVTGTAITRHSVEAAARAAELTGAKGTGLERLAKEGGGTVATNAGRVDSNSNVKADGKNSANSGVGSSIMANPWVATAVGTAQAVGTTAGNLFTFLGGGGIAGDGEMAKAGLDGLVNTDCGATIAVVMIVAGRPTGIAAESGAANRASFQMYKNELLAAMERPYVRDAALFKMLDKIYRPNAKIGSGSTAAAVRQETARSTSRRRIPYAESK